MKRVDMQKADIAIPLYRQAKTIRLEEDGQLAIYDDFISVWSETTGEDDRTVPVFALETGLAPLLRRINS